MLYATNGKRPKPDGILEGRTKRQPIKRHVRTPTLQGWSLPPMCFKLRPWMVLAPAAMSLAGCHTAGHSMLDKVDASMANIQCPHGCVGAPLPPDNADV